MTKKKPSQPKKQMKRSPRPAPPHAPREIPPLETIKNLLSSMMARGEDPCTISYYELTRHHDLKPDAVRLFRELTHSTKALCPYCHTPYTCSLSHDSLPYNTIEALRALNDKYGRAFNAVSGIHDKAAMTLQRLIDLAKVINSMHRDAALMQRRLPKKTMRKSHRKY